MTLVLSQYQIRIQNQDKLIFTIDSAYGEEVFLVRADSSFYFNVPNRVILTNRSDRNHPLQDLIFYVDKNWQPVNEIYDKNKKKVVLPINIPVNESRVLFFYIKVPLTSNQGEYLLDNLPNRSTNTENKWSISTLFDLNRLFLDLDNKAIGAELIGVHSQGTLTYYFATTKDGKKFEVNQELYIP